MQSIFEKHIKATILIVVHNICFISTDAPHIENATNSIPIQSVTIDDGSNLDLTENVVDQIEVVGSEDENAESIEETIPPPTKKVKKMSVQKLLARLKDQKHKSKHTNCFDIPRKTLKNLKKRKRASSWQEDEIPVKISKQTNNACQSQPIAVGNVNETISSNRVQIFATAPKSQPATAAPKPDFKRSNLLKITKKNSDSSPPNGRKSMHAQPVTKSNTNENDLTQNYSEPKCQDSSDGLPWKPRSSYTEQLCDYFTLQNQLDLRPSKQSTLNDTQSPPIENHGLKYKCKICEEGGSSSRVSGFVTCPFGNSSNMRRHMARVSVFQNVQQLTYVLVKISQFCTWAI